MAHLVIGTAGHIDHGKTTLVKALTGIDTDRLKEEKTRGITIELGFAHLTLPSGKTVALVDVPGHERFIKNMLAGAAGIDLALLVIAADEGVMPQTREHLAILRLLEIRRVIIVITKIDLVEPEFLDLVKEEAHELLLDTPYINAPVVNVSALKGEGISELLTVLDRVIQETGVFRRSDHGFSRLPLDRVFTISGFGTVVTGTLFNGEISVGDVLEVAIKKKKVRVRTLQVHNENVPKVWAGQRVALNLAGVETGDLERGDVLATPDRLIPSIRVDVSCLLLAGSPWSLQPLMRVRFHHGTREVLGRVVLLDREELQPGQEAFLQIVLEEPVVVLRGDNYIIRSYSPVQTIGGGRIVEPQAVKYKAKEKTRVREELEIKASGQVEAIALLYLEKKQGLVTVEEMARLLGVSPEDSVKTLMEELAESNRAISLSIGEAKNYLSKNIAARWEEEIAREIKSHFKEYPLEPGLNKEVLRAKLWSHLAVKEYNALIQYWIAHNKFSLLENQFLAPYAYEVNIEGPWAQKISEVEKIFRFSRWQVPSWGTIKMDLKMDDKMSQQVLQFLTRTNKLICLAEDLYIWRELLEEAVIKIRDWLSREKEISVAQARDLLGTTRKVAVPLLEYFDRNRVTVRVGEVRVLAERRKDFDNKNVHEV